MSENDSRAAQSPAANGSRRHPEPRDELRGHWVSVLLVVLTVLTVIFGFTGFLSQYVAQNEAKNSTEFDWTIPAYRTVQILILNSGTEEPDNFPLAVARVLAATTFLVLTAAVATRVFHESTQLPVRMTRSGHTVICGLGQIGAQLLEELHRTKSAHRVVVIECDDKNTWLDHARRIGTDIVIGDATHGEALLQARAHCAANVFIVTGDDGSNLEIAARLASMLQQKRRGGPVRVGLHLQDVKLADAFHRLSRSFSAAAMLDFHIFNMAHMSATHVSTRLLLPYVPAKIDDVAHFVILGFGSMGQALAISLAQLGHFPNLKRSRFTIADSEIDRRGREFLSRFSRFTAWSESSIGVSQFDDSRDQWSNRAESLPAVLASQEPEAIDYVANAQFWELPPDCGDEQFIEKLLASFRDSKVTVKPSIFLCGENDHENFHAAVRLRERLDCRGGNAIPIFVWLPRQPALTEALANQRSLIPFGEYHKTAGLIEVLHPQREQLAQLVHGVYEQRAVDEKKRTFPESWDAAPEVYRESNRQFVDHFHLKLAHLGWRLVNRPGDHSQPTKQSLPEIDVSTANVLAQMEHSRWVAERLMGGWRYVPRPATDREIEANKQRKLHHDLVPWDQLGSDQQIDCALLEAILDEAQKSKYRLEPIQVG